LRIKGYKENGNKDNQLHYSYNTINLAFILFIWYNTAPMIREASMFSMGVVLSLLTGCDGKPPSSTALTPAPESSPPFVTVPGSPFVPGYTITQQVGCMSDKRHLEIVIEGSKIEPTQPDSGTTELYVGDYSRQGAKNILAPVDVKEGTNAFSFHLRGEISTKIGAVELLRGDQISTVIMQQGSVIDFRPIPSIPC